AMHVLRFYLNIGHYSHSSVLLQLPAVSGYAYFSFTSRVFAIILPSRFLCFILHYFRIHRYGTKSMPMSRVNSAGRICSRGCSAINEPQQHTLLQRGFGFVKRRVKTFGRFLTAEFAEQSRAFDP